MIPSSCPFNLEQCEILAQVHDAIIATDLSGIIRVWNAGAERIYGYSAGEALGKHIGLLYFPEDAAEEDTLGPSRAKGLLMLTGRRRRKDGTEIYVSIRISTIRDSGGEAVGLVGCGHDITERKLAQDQLARHAADLERMVQVRTRHITALNSQLEMEVAEGQRIALELQENQRRLQHLLLSSPGVLYSCEPCGDYPATFLSDNATSIFGYPAAQFIGDRSFWVKHIHPDDLPEVMASANKIIEQGLFRHEYRFLHRDGTYRYIRDSAAAVRDKSEKVVEIVGYCEDITREKQAERAQKEQEKLRFLADTLLTTQEAERRRISRELHDDLNQRLASLILDIGLLERDLPRSPSETRTRLHNVKDAAARISDEVRRIARQLHSAGLEQFGLTAALEQECRSVEERAEMRVDFESKTARTILPEDVSLCLYRVAQECLRNIARHSGAKSAVVALHDCGDGIRLSVQDDGVGFEPEEIRIREGLGLISMNERVRLLNGSFRLDSGKGRGTRVEVQVPLVEETHEENQGFASG